MSINGLVLRAIEVRGVSSASHSHSSDNDNHDTDDDTRVVESPSVGLWTTEPLDANVVIGLVHKVSSRSLL